MQTKKINWFYFLYLILEPLAGITGTVLLLHYSSIPVATWVWAVVFLFMTGTAITGGYHRLFSHRSYQASWVVRLWFLLFGAAALEGSAFDWCTDHRVHHRYVDTDKDPYNINQGFWYAHIGWLFTLDESKRNYSNINDLQRDPLVSFQHRYYQYLAVFMGYIFPGLVALCWHNFWGGLIVAGLLRSSISHHFTFSVNSVCHYFGKRPYSTEQTARDNWLTAFVTYGEGFHNYHHQFPIDYRNGIRAYHYDPTKWLIRFLAYFGLTWDLKRVSDAKILRYRLLAEKQKHAPEILSPLHEKIEQIIGRMEDLEKRYRELKANRVAYVAGKMHEYRQCMQSIKQQMRDGKQELKMFLWQWSRLLAQAER